MRPIFSDADLIAVLEAISTYSTLGWSRREKRMFIAEAAVRLRSVEGIMNYCPVCGEEAQYEMFRPLDKIVLALGPAVSFPGRPIFTGHPCNHHWKGHGEMEVVRWKDVEEVDDALFTWLRENK
jgi:hypothetical protein